MKIIGDEYEKIACHYLQANQVRIIGQNIRYRVGEIDIIGTSSTGVLLFVEVKGRKSTSHGEPMEFVTAAKQRRLIQSAQQYCQINGYTDNDMRFDVISITAKQSMRSREKKRIVDRLQFRQHRFEGYQIDWIKNAFMA